MVLRKLDISERKQGASNQKKNLISFLHFGLLEGKAYVKRRPGMRLSESKLSKFRLTSQSS